MLHALKAEFSKAKLGQLSGPGGHRVLGKDQNVVRDHFDWLRDAIGRVDAKVKEESAAADVQEAESKRARATEDVATNMGTEAKECICVPIVYVFSICDCMCRSCARVGLGRLAAVRLDSNGLGPRKACNICSYWFVTLCDKALLC